MNFFDTPTQTGKVVTGEKLQELVYYIVDKFSEENLTYDEAELVVDLTKQAIGEFSRVGKVPQKDENK